MATEVLRPQDCLVDRIRVSPAAYYNRKKVSPNYGNSCSKTYARKSVARFEKKVDHSRSVAAVSRKGELSVDVKKNRSNNLLMGQVTILKRGEALDSKNKIGSEKTNKAEDLVVCGTERLGPDPDLIPKQMKMGDLKLVSSPALVSSPFDCKSVDMYAGSACSIMSPSPSSLPLPSFFNKKQVSKISDDSAATRDLRRLLRLD